MAVAMILAHIPKNNSFQCSPAISETQPEISSTLKADMNGNCHIMNYDCLGQSEWFKFPKEGML